MAVTKVASATTAGGVQLLAANAQRRGFVIENSDANKLHVYMGSGTASTTDYSFSLDQYQNAERVNYQGEILGIWAADGSGYAHITEY
jgi:hypothetical protein